MSKDDKIFITGGIFFALLTQIRISSNRSERMSGNSINATNPDILAALGAIIGKNYTKDTVNKNTASNYKKCEGQGGLKFNSKNCKQYFRYGIENHYDILLERTKVLFQKYIVNDENERQSFAKQLYRLLNQNNNLDNAEFYYLGANVPLSLHDFLSIKQYKFMDFVLSIWNAIICTCGNNKIGRSTFDRLFYYDANCAEFYLNESKISGDIDSVSFEDVLSPENEIIFDDTDFILPSKEEKTKTSDTITVDEIIVNDEPKQEKNVNNRIINISGGNYFEHVENLIIKDGD